MKHQPIIDEVKDDDEDFTLVSAPTELTITKLDNNDVDQDEGLLGPTADVTDASPVVVAINWPIYDPDSASNLAAVEWSALVAWKWLAVWKRFAGGLCLLLIATSVLFAFSQTASLLRSIEILPYAFRLLCYASLSLLWLALLAAIASALSIYFKLKSSPKVSMSALDTLTERGRSGLKSDLNYARVSMVEFLRSYPQTKEQLQLLATAGIGGTSTCTVNDLFGHIKFVLANSNGNTKQWLDSVQSAVLDPLDNAADKLIKTSALKVGVKTSISPRGVIDSLIILTHSWLLIGNLCRLYNVRPNVCETCIIFGFTGFNALVSDKSDVIASKFEETIAEEGATYVGGATANLLSMVSSRAAEGAVNALLTYRLGQQLKTYLRPVQP